MIDIHDQLHVSGYVLIPSYVPEAETVQTISKLGSVSRISGVNEKQLLVPLEPSRSTPNTYSGNYGLSAFPLHTDLAHWHLPPRYLALRCIVGTESVATRLMDTRAIVSAIGRNELRRILVHPRRAICGGRGLLRLLETPAGQEDMFRWDLLFIKPATEFSRSAMEEVKRLIATESEKKIYLTGQGDTLIVDNWRMLHGRAPVNQNAILRKIERVYLEEVFC